MKIFIDTNIFLSFYHLTSDDLEELRKLVHLIEKREVNLLIPQQVIDETWRNRATKIKDRYEPLKKHKFTITFPAYCKNYQEYETIRSSLKECEKEHPSLIKKLQEDIDNHNLAADSLLKNLFEISETIDRTSEIVCRARDRVDLGNPPGKKGSLGDAINWESLLKVAKPILPMTIISDDSDLYSPLNTEELDDFLKDEWKKVTGSTPKFYRKLSLFFKDNFPDIHLETEIEKDALIEQLSRSSSFAQTHSIISRLSKYNQFLPKQVDDLMSALILNEQVKWIFSDSDVYEFYKNIIDQSCYEFFGEYASEVSDLIKEFQD